MIFNAVETQRKKAVFKETINAIQSIISDKAADPKSNVTILSLLSSRLNVDKCSNSLILSNNWSMPAMNRGCILNNGVYILHLDENNTRTVADIVIDYNGDKDPNDDTDRMGLLINYGTTDTTTAFGHSVQTLTGGRKTVLRPGEYSIYAWSNTLYNSLYE